MPRTTSQQVQAILLDQYGARANGTLPVLTPFIDSATNMVDQVRIDAAARGVTLSNVTLELIERWLAAHFYTKADPLLTSKSQGGVSGAFQMGRDEPEPFKDMATALDPSGCLNALLKRQRASAGWLGKIESQQLDYDQRN